MATQQTGNPQQNVAGQQLQGNNQVLQPAGDRQVFGAFDSPAYKYDPQLSSSSGGLAFDQTKLTESAQKVSEKVVTPAKNILQDPWFWGVFAFITVLVVLAFSVRRSSSLS